MSGKEITSPLSSPGRVGATGVYPGDVEICAYRLPLRTPFRGLTQRCGCLIRGGAGWGEFAPFDDYPAAADARWLQCAREQADRRWPQPVRREVAVNAIIPAVAPSRAAEMARASGCTTIKIKVGDAEGFARVAAVRAALPEARLRVDVNGGWTIEQAVVELRALHPLGLEYAEQPVRSFDDMARLRSAVDVPLAADELIRVDRRFADVRDVADVAVLKVPTLGGVAATLEAAATIGLPVVISSALDSSLGLAAGLAAACALPVEPLACGLGTSSLFAWDTAEPLLPVNGIMTYIGYPDPLDDLPRVPSDEPAWRRRMVV
jgi:O-succinylbenzoate synthase